LLANAFTKYTVGYQKVSNAIHPTKLTNAKGEPLAEIPAAEVGILSENQTVAHNYLFDELFFDSELERENILQNIDSVTVFTKIPKNSIKIPVAGGKTYSPDFAYIVQYKNQSQQLHFVIESKNVPNDNALREEEKLKIRHAVAFFKGKVNIHFKTQFSNDKIISLLQQTYGEF
jgi:type III restriction-modification system ecoPI enzyme res